MQEQDKLSHMIYECLFDKESKDILLEYLQWEQDTYRWCLLLMTPGLAQLRDLHVF